MNGDALIDWIIFTSLLAHAGHIGTDRSLLTEYDALLLGQIARDLLHASLHRHNDTWTAFFEPVVGTGGNSSIALWQPTTFLKQADHTGHEPGRTAWQTETLQTVLFPRPLNGDANFVKKSINYVNLFALKCTCISKCYQPFLCHNVCGIFTVFQLYKSVVEIVYNTSQWQMSLNTTLIIVYFIFESISSESLKKYQSQIKVLFCMSSTSHKTKRLLIGFLSINLSNYYTL